MTRSPTLENKEEDSLVEHTETVLSEQVSTETSGFAALLETLRSNNFVLFWSGALVSNIGTWLQQVALGWLVITLTNSSFLLGLVNFTSTIPGLVLSVIGGILADRVNRRYLLLISQGLAGLLALALAIPTQLHIITIAQIILISLLGGILIALTAPAWQVFVSELVPRSQLPRAIALNATQFNFSRLIGPAVAGVLISLIGLAGAFYLNALSFVAVIIALLLVRPQATPAVARTAANQGSGAPPRESTWAALVAACRYVAGSPSLRIILILQGIVSFTTFPALALLPVFARDIYHQGAAGLGLLTAANGAGSFIGAVTSAWLSELKDRRLVLLVTSGVSGLSFLAFALAQNEWFALGMLALAGAAMIAANTLSNVTLQTLVSRELRGRVISLWTTIFFGMVPIGSLLAGFLASITNAPFAVGTFAVICLLGTAITSQFKAEL